MPLNEKIQHVTGGTKSARDKINPTIDAANSVSRIVGDGLVRVTHGTDGVTVGLNMNQVEERLPRWSRIRYGVAAPIDARSDNCAWIRPSDTDARYTYVQEASLDFPFDGSVSAPEPISTSNESEYIKVYFAGRGDPAVFAGDVIPYVLVKDPANTGTPYGVAIGNGFFDLPVLSTTMQFLSGVYLHSGWVKFGSSARGVGTSLSDGGLNRSLLAFPGAVPFSTGTPAADSIFSATSPGTPDSHVVGPPSSLIGQSVIYGLSLDFYLRVH